MRRTTITALVVTSTLGLLLAYVAEDIPRFGDPEAPTIKFVKLFNLALDGLEPLLNSGEIPDALALKLLERGLPRPTRVEKALPPEAGWNAFVTKEELGYANEEKYYGLRKEGNELAVFRYAFVVRWIEKGKQETGIPNMVTYGLADYRGHDTLGETTVIFTAGVSVILLLRRRGRL